MSLLLLFRPYRWGGGDTHDGSNGGLSKRKASARSPKKKANLGKALREEMRGLPAPEIKVLEVDLSGDDDILLIILGDI